MFTTHEFCKARLKLARQDLPKDKNKKLKGWWVDKSSGNGGNHWFVVWLPDEVKHPGVSIWSGWTCCKWSAKAYAVERMLAND